MKKLNKPTVMAVAAIAVGIAALSGFAENPLEMLVRIGDLLDAS
jgi:hypothetical protein